MFTAELMPNHYVFFAAKLLHNKSPHAAEKDFGTCGLDLYLSLLRKGGRLLD